MPALIMGFALLVCGVLAASELWREWRARGLALEQAQLTTANLALSLVRQAEETFEIMDTAVSGLVGRLEQTIPSTDALESVSGALRVWGAKMPVMRSLAVLGPDGRVLATSTDQRAIGDDRSHAPYFQHHMADAGREPFLGPPLKASDGRMVLTVSRRLEGADGSFRGVVRAAIDVDYFHDFYVKFAIPAGSVIALLHRDGAVLSRYPLDEDAIGRPFAGLPVAAGAANGPLPGLKAASGAPQIGASRLASSYPVMAVASFPEDKALEAWRKQASWRIAAAIPVILLILAAAGLLGHQVARRHRADLALREAEARFRLVAENSSDMLCRVDDRGYQTYVSPASRRLLGLEPRNLIGGHSLDRIHAEDRPRVEDEMLRLRESGGEAVLCYRAAHRNGAEIWLETTVRVLTDPTTGRCNGAVTSSRDVTDRKRLEAKLLELARTDGLTGLANRRSFDEALSAEWHRALRMSAPLSLVLLDVDRYKLFNDAYGHRAGDECLRFVAGAIRNVATRPGDLVARYGGEEIALLLPGTDAVAAYRIAEYARRAVQDLGQAHSSNAPYGVITASVGVATFQAPARRPGDRAGAEPGPADLVEVADQALYAAKRDGRNRVITAPALTGTADPQLRAA